MAETYLIAHRVRGERAFDVAELDDNGWWIIPTSGHRAYPFWWYKLADLFAYENVGQPPDDLRDHYMASEQLRHKPKPAPAKRTSFDAPTAEEL